MIRREFLTLIGGAAAAWPFPGQAQEPTMPVVGFLNGGSEGYAAYLVPFRQGLKDAGYKYRWAEGSYDRLPALAADLVDHQVTVIVVNTPAVRAAQAAKDDSDSFCDRGRPGRAWICPEPEPTGRQYYRRGLSVRRGRTETLGDSARVVAYDLRDCLAYQSDQPHRRNYLKGRAGVGTRSESGSSYFERQYRTRDRHSVRADRRTASRSTSCHQ